MASSLTELLVPHLMRPVSHRAREKAAVHVLDWLGTVLAGLTTEDGRIMVAYARDAGTGPCHVPGVGGRDAAMAAFVNGGLAITLELDDMHLGARLHPGDAVIPAAFACAEACGAGGREFLDAVVRGYEAAIRVGESVGPGHYRLWHNTSTCGPFGSAAAACSLLNLPQDAWVNALGNAGTQACGLWQCRDEKVMSKVIHSGRAAESGLLAAFLAGQGLTGPRYVLEGPCGFYAATCPDPDPSALARKSTDPDWKIHEVTLKPWAACGHVHPCIDAALSLSGRIDKDSIERIRVRTYAEAVVFADCAEPYTDLEHKFSLQHAAAVGLLGDASLAQFSTPVPDQVRALRAVVDVEVGAPAGASADQAWGAELEVSTRDGRTISSISRHTKGSPDKPMSMDEVAAKFCDLASLAGVASGAAQQAIDAAFGTARGGSFAGLALAVSDLFPSPRPHGIGKDGDG